MRKICPHYDGRCSTENLDVFIDISGGQRYPSGLDKNPKEYFKEAKELLKRKTMPSYARALLLVDKAVTKKTLDICKSVIELLADDVCHKKFTTCPTYKSLNK